jgi:hypothetical protein
MSQNEERARIPEIESVLFPQSTVKAGETASSERNNLNPNYLADDLTHAATAA